jgi:peptide/nickel transport system substrate-binding protein
MEQGIGNFGSPKPKTSRRAALKLSLALGTMSLLGHSPAAAQPVRGGSLKLASRHGSTTDSTDPALGTNGYQVLLGLAFANTLTEVLPDGTVGSALAESWDSSDAKVWQFKLRRGVTFHDGRPFKASDAVASLNHHRSAESKSYVKPIMEQFDTVEAPGEHELRIRLKNPNADLPAILNVPAFAIFPADGEKMDWSSRNGTGGYILKEFEPGQRAHLVRNPNYYRDDRAFFEEAELLCIQDSTARTNALLSGEVHAIDEVDLKTSSLLSSQQSIVLERVAGPLHYTFPMRTDVAPFNDVNVRLALKYAIDREEILDKILFGFGSLGNDTPIGPSYRYWAKGLEQRAYDPDRAKFHLKKANMENLKVDLSTAEAAFSGATDAATLYAEHARKAGIEINVIREANDAYWDNVWMKKPFCACYWGGYPTEGEMFAIGYAPGAAWNDTYWTDPKFESLRMAVLAELDTGKRRAMYAEMQQIVHNDGGALVFAFAEYVMALSKNLAHGPLSTGGAFDSYRAVERWWFAA